MDDTQRIVKCGNLSLHSPGGFFKKRWHGKYLVLYDGSKSGIKRLELFDSEIKFKKQNPAKIIPLVDCVRVVTCQRHKTTYTFEVRTSDQFYLLAAQSFQDMNDWVNCLRLVAFGQSSSGQPTSAASGPNSSAMALQTQRDLLAANKRQSAAAASNVNSNRGHQQVDVLLEKSRSQQQHSIAASSSPKQPAAVSSEPHPVLVASLAGGQPALTTASQAAAAAASALAKTRQRQPSLLGSCKPQPPTDSPFIKATNKVAAQGGVPTTILNSIGQMDTMTPTVRGQLIGSGGVPELAAAAAGRQGANQSRPGNNKLETAHHQPASLAQSGSSRPATLDEEEENMLYCSIEDNPSEHNYRVKVIETELSLRCQLKCYQLTAPTTISQQYEQLGRFNPESGAYERRPAEVAHQSGSAPAQQVTFYQLIIGPQELTLLNDYTIARTLKQYQASQQQGLWSWPYQCIRRYGFDKDNCFMFEAGRKCSSGPGQFIVQTPKAHNIYQDVVKFVNELRSLSSTLEESAGNKSMQTALAEQPTNLRPQSAVSAVVTQIPVTWTPVPAQAQPDSRQHFFETLRHNMEQQSVVNLAPPISEHLGSTTTHKSQNCIATHQDGTQLTSAIAQPIRSSSLNVINADSPAKLSHATSRNPFPESDSHFGAQSMSLKVIPDQASMGERKRTDRNIDGSQVKQQAAGQQVSRQQQDLEVGLRSQVSMKCDPGNTFEETDESGYEHGDDSVDGSASRLKMRNQAGQVNVGRRRQANDSMSSASSTSSGGSPGHSVSRRSAGGINCTGGPISGAQGPSKRPSLLSATRESSQQQGSGKETSGVGKKLAGVRSLLEAHQSDELDFEANLIRDVYSEITKLHATFAVTTNGGSAGNSMSSISSTSNCNGSSSNEDNNSANSNEQSQGEEEDEEEEEEDEDEQEEEDEPMYTNLKLSARRRLRADFDESMERDLPGRIDRHHQGFDGDRIGSKTTTTTTTTQQNYRNHTHEHYQQQQQHHLSNANHYANANPDYLSSPRSGPFQYPSILNPIPECGEPQQLTSGRSLANNNHNNNNNNNINLNHNNGLQEAGLGANNNKPDLVRRPNSVARRQFQSPIGARSAPPTNHYLINDVQYAKISRNMRSNSNPDCEI